MQRRTCYFSGTVQGVGFRFTAHSIARQFEITGFVRNLPDGRVQVVAEGDADQLDRFVEAIREQMGGYIRSVSCETAPPTAEFASFGIRH